MSDLQQTLAVNIRRLRQERGLSQEKLALAAELDLTYVGGIERSKRNPSLLVMARLAKVLQTTVPALLTSVEARQKSGGEVR